MKLIYVLVAALSIATISCKTKDGEPGPAGETFLKKQGNITATVTYKDDNGNDATTKLDYQYYETLAENYFVYNESIPDSYYEMEVTRRDVSDANNIITFYLEGYSTDGIESLPDDYDIDIDFNTLINNELLAFEDSDITISNLALDHTTGRLTFNFTGDLYKYTGTYYNATISGSVDVILNRVRPNND